jgi:hypothetical protein
MSRAQYEEQVKQAIAKFNEEQGSINDLLKVLKTLDDEYFGSDSKKIIMSRHGQCGLLQKVLGANPNAGLEDSCKTALQLAAANTVNFLRADKGIRFISSPMLRSLQTAALLLPTTLFEGEKLTLEQNHALAENSEDLSGKNIKSAFDLIKHMVITLPVDTIKYMFAPKLTMPLRMVAGLVLFPFRLLETVLSLVLWPFLGHNLKKNIQTVNEHLTSKGFNSHVPEPSEALSDAQKIKAIDTLIDRSNQDIWLFGHGKNFKTYFKEKVGISESFDYADVRTLFKKANGTYEAAIYVLHVSQKTGAIFPKILNSPLVATENPKIKAVTVTNAGELKTSHKLCMHVLLAGSDNEKSQADAQEITVKPVNESKEPKGNTTVSDTGEVNTTSKP